MTIEKGAKKNSNCVDPQFKKINILSSSSSCEKNKNIIIKKINVKIDSKNIKDDVL